jgi:Mg2+ and Co2+ transporter CorA
MVCQFAVYNPLEKVSQKAEIDFIISNDEVVSIQYEPLEIIDEIKEQFKNKEPQEKAEICESSLTLTHYLIQSLLSYSVRQLHHIGKKVDEVSAQLFADREQEILRDLSYLKRDISEYRIIFRSQGPLFNSLLEAGTEFWGKESIPYINDLIADHAKIANLLEDYRMAVIDFEQTNTQLLNARTNQVVKTFTILAFSTFPLTLVAALLSIPTNTKPIIGMPNDFWIIVGTMGVALLTMFAIFKIKKWL